MTVRPSPRMRPPVTDHVNNNPSTAVAFAINVTSAPVGQLGVDVPVVVCGHGKVMDDFDAWIVTMGGRLQRA